jgi:hypothetical protein
VLAIVAVASITPLAMAQNRTEITVQDTGASSENLTSTQDGTVFFGSTTKGTIYTGPRTSSTPSSAESCD